MTCLECGAKMKPTRENVKYEASGLPGITLLQVEVRRCPKCGEYELVIPNLGGLHRAIASALVQKRSRLTPAEIRFLRKSLGWSGADFARAMGTTAETVSRWENGATPMGVQADKLLRLMVVHVQPVQNYGEEEMKVAATDAAKPLRTAFKVRGEQWQPEAA